MEKIIGIMVLALLFSCNNNSEVKKQQETEIDSQIVDVGEAFNVKIRNDGEVPFSKFALVIDGEKVDFQGCGVGSETDAKRVDALYNKIEFDIELRKDKGNCRFHEVRFEDEPLEMQEPGNYILIIKTFADPDKFPTVELLKE